MTAPSSPASRHRLFEEFAPATADQWRQAAEALLKGKPFEKSLITRTPEGIDLQPIFGADDIASLSQVQEPPGFGTRRRGARPSGYLRGPWLVSQEAPFSTAEEFNAAARQDVARGQTELNILLDLATLAGIDPDQAQPGEVGACGLSLATLDDAERALAGISLADTSIYLRAGASALPAAALLLALARKRHIPTDRLRGCIEVDPLSMLAWKGDLPVSLELAWREMAAITSFAITHAPRLQTVAVQSHFYRDAGATAVQELGFALATGVEYLRALQRFDIGIDDASTHLRFALSAGSNFFMEVAKFRAARIVWSRVIEALGGQVAARNIHLHARTSTHNKTACDALNNLLRTTTEALSAVVGGCQSLHVGPYDEVVRVPDEFSRRIARNSHAILAEECGLTKQIDPAGGSYYVEWLTDQVARHAWSLFQEVEKRGGMEKALLSGFVQEQVAVAAQKNAAAVASRRTVIVGTNQYANPKEKRLDATLPDYTEIHHKRAQQIAAFRTRLSVEADTEILASLGRLLECKPAEALPHAIEAVSLGATLGEVCRVMRAVDEPVPPIPRIRVHRAAQPFEHLRDLSDRFAAQAGHRPRILQANIGASRGYRGRADWTTGFFEVAGFEVLADTDFNDAAEISQVVNQSGATIVVLTSSDTTYVETVESLARALKQQHPRLHLLVAGQPGEREPAWREAGVDGFVNLRTNALELLTQLIDRFDHHS